MFLAVRAASVAGGKPMASVALYAATLAVAARRLEDTSCPCIENTPSGTGYPTFTLAGTTISYDDGALQLNPISKTRRSRSLYSSPRDPLT